MRYRKYICHLVSCILPGYLHPISQPRRVSYPRPFPARIFLNVPPMQTPGIRSNIQKCQTTRSAVPVYRCGVSLLYIKQLYTLPSVSRCQPPKLKSEYNTDVRLTRLDNTSPSSPNRLHTKFKLRLQLAFTKCSSLDAVCVSDSHRLL